MLRWGFLLVVLVLLLADADHFLEATAGALDEVQDWQLFLLVCQFAILTNRVPLLEYAADKPRHLDSALFRRQLGLSM